MSQTPEQIKAAQSASRRAERDALLGPIAHPWVAAVRAYRERKARFGPFPINNVIPGDRLCACGHDFGRPASRSDLIQHFALHSHAEHLYPCPECAKRLPPLPKGNAPLPECACRICRWLRENVAYEAKRG